MDSLVISAIVLMALGFIVTIGARFIVEKFNLNKNMNCDFESELSEEELEDYKFRKAVVSCKMLGMLIALPGIIIILIVFRNR